MLLNNNSIICFITIDLCEYSYTQETIPECGNQKADYLYGEYRFIPKESKYSVSMGETPAIALDQTSFGVLKSNLYPKIQDGVNDTIILATLDFEKAIKVYLTDLYIGGAVYGNRECAVERIELSDGVC